MKTVKISQTVRIWLILNFILIIAYNSLASVNDISKQDSILLKADQIDYEKNTMIYAKGNVLISQKNNFLMADQVHYNYNNETIQAFGRVSLLLENGDIIYSDELSFKSDISGGYINNLGTRLGNNSSIAASGALISLSTYQLNRAVFTSCSTHQNHPPQWQIKAKKVVIDKQLQRVTYLGASFELYGLPIFYLPYFSHPTPKATKVSGVLTPTVSPKSSTTGFGVKIPYYFNIANNQELIVAPIFTSKAGIIYTTEYNYLSKNLSSHSELSITNKKVKNFVDDRNRYYFSTKDQVKFNDSWQATLSLKKVSDISYLRDYNFNNTNFLKSTILVEHVSNNNYTSIKSIDFKRLRKFNKDERSAPFILPSVASHFQRNDFINRSRLNIDFDLLGINHTKQNKTRRLILAANNIIPIKTKHGSLLKFTTYLREDLYHIKYHPAYKLSHHQSKVSRFIPTAQLDYSLPMINNHYQKKWLIEPQVNIITSPNQRKSHLLLNEDSSEFEINDNNLFEKDHYSGYDKIESGTRINYALSSTIYQDKNNFNIMLAQHRRLDNILLTNNKKSSDYIGKISGNFAQKLELAYRFSLSKPNFHFSRHELEVLLSANNHDLAINYTRFDNKTNNDQKQIQLLSNIKISKQILMSLGARYNLTRYHRKLLTSGIKFTYIGDCINITYQINKDLTTIRSNNKKNSLTHLVSFSLKNLSN